MDKEKRQVPEGFDSWYDYRENKEIVETTRVHIQKIHEFMISEKHVPTIQEVMELTGFGYHWAGDLRRRAIREFPAVDIEELAEEAKMLLIKRIRSGEIDDTNLVRLMPYIAEQKGSKTDIKQEITHKFIVIKPDEKTEEE